VRVSVTTTEAPGEVHTTRRRRMVEVERVALDQEVETPPPVRQEGDLVVVPVLEERLVVVRRLFVTEEIRFRIAVEEEAVTLSLPLARQEVSVTRLPPPEVTSTSDDSMNRGDPLMQRTLTAMFDSRAEAERAAETLRGLGIGAQNIRMHQADAGSGQAGTTGTGSTTTGTTGTPREDRGILGAIADLFMPDDDRATYSEGLRRGATLVLAEVDEARMHQAMDAMEAAGAVDLDEREADWRQQGWSGGSMAGVSSGSVESSMVMPDTDTRTGVDTGIPAHGSTGTGMQHWHRQHWHRRRRHRRRAFGLWRDGGRRWPFRRHRHHDRHHRRHSGPLPRHRAGSAWRAAASRWAEERLRVGSVKATPAASACVPMSSRRRSRSR
jgi:hypothetical protein